MDNVTQALEAEARELLARQYDQEEMHFNAQAIREGRCRIFTQVPLIESAIMDALRQRDEARAALTYTDARDTPDEYSDAILDAFPTRGGNWKQYTRAMEIVSNRHSKGALVNLVNWLLIEREKAEADRDRLLAVVRPFAEFARNNVSAAGWTHPNGGCQYERIVDWFGPSDFRAAADAVREMGG